MDIVLITIGKLTMKCIQHSPHLYEPEFLGYDFEGIRIHYVKEDHAIFTLISPDKSSYQLENVVVIIEPYDNQPTTLTPFEALPISGEKSLALCTLDWKPLFHAKCLYEDKTFHLCTTRSMFCLGDEIKQFVLHPQGLCLVTKQDNTKCIEPIIKYVIEDWTDAMKDREDMYWDTTQNMFQIVD